MLIRLLLTLLVLLASRAQRAEGQRAPFDEISLTASAFVDLGGGMDDSGYHALWTPGPGLALHASTPFYLGRAHAGLQFSIHDGQRALPAYLAMLGYGGIGPDLRLPGRIRAEPVLMAGILSMDFYEDEDIPPAGRRESELVIGAGLHLSRPLTRRLHVAVGAQAVQVYTNPRFRLASATAGLQWRMATPRWLRTLLDS